MIIKGIQSNNTIKCSLEYNFAHLTVTITIYLITIFLDLCKSHPISGKKRSTIFSFKQALLLSEMESSESYQRKFDGVNIVTWKISICSHPRPT